MDNPKYLQVAPEGMQDLHAVNAAPKTSDYGRAKKFREFKIQLRRLVIDACLLSMAVISAGFGLKSFLLPNNFVDGGAVGIALLIKEVTGLSVSILLILVNIPFIILGYTTISREFAIKTAAAITALSLLVAFFPYPQVTQDKLLVAVFGGFFLGTGTGLAVRGGGVIDGSEVLAINISRKNGLSIGDIIILINVIIFSFAAYLLSFEIALYSVLTYMAAARTVDFIIEGIEEYTGVTIVSVKSDIIRKMISEDMGRGFTVYKGERGFGKTGHHSTEIKIIYTVITRLEVSRLKNEIEKIDPEAFVIMNSVKDTKGGMIKKRPLK